jgi:hypothetical protein
MPSAHFSLKTSQVLDFTIMSVLFSACACDNLFFCSHG